MTDQTQTETSAPSRESGGALPPSALGLTPEKPNPSGDRPAIYVACLAAYNNGQLHGAWIWAEDAEDMQAATRKMLAASPQCGAEEWAIHDYAGFEGLQLSEYQSFECVAEMAAFIEKHGELGAKTAEYFGGNVGEARTALTENYQGKYESLADFAQGFHEDCGTEIPPAFRNYIDWDSLGRDMSSNGDITVIEMGYHVHHIFWAR